MTVCSGLLRLAGTATAPFREASRQAASTSAGSRPSTAAMAPGRRRPASSISSPRRRTSRAASVAARLPAAMWALYSPRLWPAAALASASRSPTTASTAAECARIAGWALWVRVSSSSGPSHMMRESGAPSASSIAAKVSRAAGNRSASSFPIPTFCAPWPGHITTVTTGRRRCPR